MGITSTLGPIIRPTPICPASRASEPTLSHRAFPLWFGSHFAFQSSVAPKKAYQRAIGLAWADPCLLLSPQGWLGVGKATPPVAAGQFPGTFSGPFHGAFSIHARNGLLSLGPTSMDLGDLKRSEDRGQPT